MKLVHNLDGSTQEVENNVIVKMIDDKYYFLTEQEQAEIELARIEWEAGQVARDAQAILDKRAREYPAPQSGSDILWHYLKWMKLNKQDDYATLPLEVMEWFDTCESVKLNNPKV